MVERVLGHIAWLLKEVQKSDSDVTIGNEKAAVEIITKILYERECKLLPLIWEFEEFCALIELGNRQLKHFFDELYISTNLSTKNKDTMKKTPNLTIDTLAILDLSMTSYTISYHNYAVFKKQPMTVKSKLSENANNAMILNIDDYYSIHTKRIPNIVITSTAAHLTTVLLNLIKNELVIPK
ncbi:3492_t:CDS:2 [Funneliformis caledonium]|uniref:3492_t:CDS:1 n=1 Tax=Funneliformis caledonium TaxID=1117310 RepID=A0A9N9HMU6_9GLOM|nr:3492_t:CDS:2 [Funneliformis caledonium]